MKNPCEDSTTTKSPSKSPPQSPPSPFDDVPMEANPTMQDSSRVEVEVETLKTPMQVLEELNAGDDDGDGDGSLVGGGTGMSQSGASVAVAVVGGSMVVEGGGGSVMNEGQGKKRKASQVQDPPTGKPTCPLCKKQFLTWKGAFGHMRKHPDRAYRGFFRPPVFASTDPPKGDGEENSKGKEKQVASYVGGLSVDLNQQMEEEESSDAVERNEVPESAAKEKVADEGNRLEFDLNELPPDEDDE